VRWVGRGLVLLILAFLGHRLISGWGELAAAGVRVAVGYLAGGVLVYFGNRLLSVEIWRWLLVKAGEQRPRFTDALDVCARSWMGRYLPGKIWVVGGKVWLGQRIGLAPRILAVVSFTELCLWIVCCATAGALFLLGASRLGHPAIPLLPVAAAVAVGALCMAPPVFRRFLNLAARLLRRRPLAPSEVLGSGTLLGAFLRNLGILSISSAGWFLMLAALLPTERISTGLWLLAAGGSAVSGILGMLAFFAPGGLGVREGSLAAILATALPWEAAIAVALLARLRVVLGDGLFLLGSALWSARDRRRRGRRM
jgi:hypothetical protein